jgi:hypothetical protein
MHGHGFDLPKAVTYPGPPESLLDIDRALRTGPLWVSETMIVR